MTENKDHDPEAGRRISPEELEKLKELQAEEDAKRLQVQEQPSGDAADSNRGRGSGQTRSWENEKPQAKASAGGEEAAQETFTLPSYSATRALTEGALLAVLAAILGIASLYLPIGGILLMLIWPLPLALVVLRHGLPTGFLSTVVTGVLLSLFMGPAQGLLMLVNMAGVGLCFGYCFRKQIPAAKTLFIGTLIAAVSVALAIFLSTWVSGISWGDFMTQSTAMLDDMLNTYQKMGVLEGLTGPNVTLEQFRTQIITMMQVLLPAAFVVISMLTAAANYFISKAILRRLGYPTGHLRPFQEWQMPWQMLWGVIAGLGLLILGSYTDQKMVSKIGANILYVVVPILMVFGISFFVWSWKHMKSAGIRMALLLFVFFTLQYCFVIFPLIGLTDSIVDLRALFLKRRERA